MLAAFAGGDANRVTVAERGTALIEDWTLAWLARAEQPGAPHRDIAALGVTERSRAQALLRLVAGGGDTQSGGRQASVDIEGERVVRARGWNVSLPLTDEAVPFSRGNHLEVVSTETRNAATLEAAAIIRRVVAVRRATGAPLLFKKIDSTLRGPIAAELNALITELAPPLV